MFKNVKMRYMYWAHKKIEGRLLGLIKISLVHKLRFNLIAMKEIITTRINLSA